ncbi:phage tail sheath family protein [Corallococcus llansteffanensis]|uniref:Phage tail sheath family protein n=1 Tax=Corallococcus llansteffanensis TaxID=2316731 RepID=A0A3A8NTM8_9BACT|nr:phage tail sheath subtilisin-like domain-containing protein [Corallococcus llansteffanensis]RKH43372.1 phage tail sheath family protein [Corallococcus llansteffanensis]
MPEYLAPGVFVEETSFRAKSIEGVSTTTTGFIGPTRYGPVDLQPDLITSMVEFERVYGGRRQLGFKVAGTLHNYTWHAVRAFFEEGGKRLYVGRVFRKQAGTSKKYGGFESATTLVANNPSYDDGHARGLLAGEPTDVKKQLLAYGRYPGSAGNLRVRFTLRAGQNVLSFEGGKPRVSSLQDRDVVVLRDFTTVPPAVADAGAFYQARWNEVKQDWDLVPATGTATALSSLTDTGNQLRIITVTVAVIPTDEPGASQVWSGLALDKVHARDGAEDSLQARFNIDASDLERNRGIPIVLAPGSDLGDGLAMLTALLKATPNGVTPTVTDALKNPDSTDLQRTVEVLLQGGNDGERPTADEYQGEQIVNTTRKTGLVQFEDLEDISIVAAPGSTFNYEGGYSLDANTIINLLISHCQRMHYRIAVLDSGNGQTLNQVRAQRAKIDSSYAALYYPWVKVLDPVTRQPIFLPPSGFVAGIYARNDVNRAVYKAPANEVVNLALGFESNLSKSQQEVLNPEGINAFRYFEGRGYRLWGARTTSSDPEWKYVNLRRYFAYLERSIDKGTQWAVFEPNGDQLWASVRRTIEDFLLNEWQMGALLGDKPEKAYFVKCDRSTMTQNDLDNGRLVCLIGVAPLRPAEFVIFRIGQWTGDRK